MSDEKHKAWCKLNVWDRKGPCNCKPPSELPDSVRRRLEHNESVVEKCVAIMREHDKRAQMANFARCGCEFCKVVRYCDPPNEKGQA